ncbi:hypothetical protein L7F22_047704 [Adiantum nelumboides]|nr:hypothetical protein [Adiantum nelumboides]
MAASATVLGTTQDAPRPITWTYELTPKDETEMQTAIEHFSGRTLVGRLLLDSVSTDALLACSPISSGSRLLVFQRWTPQFDQDEFDRQQQIPRFPVTLSFPSLPIFMRRCLPRMAARWGIVIPGSLVSEIGTPRIQVYALGDTQFSDLVHIRDRAGQIRAQRMYGWRMKQIVVVPTIKRQFCVVRGAITEDLEAEKALIEEDALERMEKTLESVKTNFNTVRTGRASPALLDRIEVEYYGTLVSLKSIAQVSTPDGSSLLIQPFDKSSLSSVEKAISKSDVGLSPSNDGNAIRMYIPPLTEERRKELLKMVSKLSEDGKIAIRNIRRDAIRTYEKLEKEKKLPADNVKDLTESMQKLTDDYVKKIDTQLKQKEKELLTV